VNRRCWMESFESADVQPARTLPRRRIRSQRSAIDLYTRRPATTAFRSLSDRHLLLLIETARNAALARDRRNVVGYGAAAPRPQQIRRTTGVPALVRSECNPVPLEANLNAISGVADGIRTTTTGITRPRFRPCALKNQQVTEPTDAERRARNGNSSANLSTAGSHHWTICVYRPEAAEEAAVVSSAKPRRYSLNAVHIRSFRQLFTYPQTR
jgi:hypothetical protein